MTITPTTLPLNLLQGAEGYVRSPGLHVSDLYNAYYQKVDPKRYSHDGPPNTVKMAMGLAWEAYLESLLQRQGFQAERPGEFTIHVGDVPIAFSPDLYISNCRDRIGEIKLTYMSWSEDLGEPKFAKWKTQVMVYGHHLQVYAVTFFVLFVAGDYKQNRDPIFQTYHMEFSPQEAQDEWDTLVSVGRMEKML